MSVCMLPLFVSSTIECLIKLCLGNRSVSADSFIGSHAVLQDRSWPYMVRRWLLRQPAQEATRLATSSERDTRPYMVMASCLGSDSAYSNPRRRPRRVARCLCACWPIELRARCGGRSLIFYRGLICCRDVIAGYLQRSVCMGRTLVWNNY